MIEILPIAVGVGLVISLLFSEFFGLAPGGMVVPGYIALFLIRPWDVLATVVCAIATYFLVQLLSSLLILYGKRRTVLAILTGYILGMAFDWFFPGLEAFGDEKVRVIGFIIPGLLAIWLDRQGIVETLSTLTIVSVMVRMVLILVLGGNIP